MVARASAPAEVDNECALCALVGAAEPPIGPWVLRSDLVVAFMSPQLSALPGWFQLQVRRHADGWWSLRPDEAQAIGTAVQQLSAAIRAVTGCERVYSYSMCENNPHLHLVLGAAPSTPVRGAELLTRILRRDSELFDEPEAGRVAEAVRARL